MAKAGSRRDQILQKDPKQPPRSDSSQPSTDPGQCRKSILNMNAASTRYRFMDWQPAATIFPAMTHKVAAMTDTPLVERRSETRRRVFKGGVITFNGAGIDCTVRNMSKRGAALDVANAAMIPPRFSLAIKADDFIARCRMVWNNGQRVGITFD